MKDQPKTLTPQLRFPEFRDRPGWELRSLASALDYERPENYIVASTAYQSSGIPVLTANKSFILGYTNEEEGVFSDVPVIIFDDFTTDRKYVDFPFKVKSSAIKILKRKSDDELKLIFELMGGIRFDPKEHKRYYISQYQYLEIPLPREDEQRTIAACLTSFDELLAAEGRKLEALRVHKKGLMQQLFPRKGESRPHLRFPEFRDGGDWETRPLGELLSRPPEYGVNAPAVTYSPNLPTYIRITDIDDDGNFLAENKASVDINTVDDHYLTEGDVVLARTGASVGKSYRYRPDDGRLVFAGFLIRISADKSKLDSLFLNGFLATQRYWDWVAMTSARSGQPGINATEYASMPIPIPPMTKADGLPAEQQRIAACLSSLDALIAAQWRKLVELQTHKGGLMQQLFPSPERV